MARTPILGAVKRRLATRIGDAAALQIYERLLGLALAAAARAVKDRPGWRLELRHLGPPFEAGADLPVRPQLVPQGGRDFAFNLEDALHSHLSHPEHASLVVGADHPDLAPSHIWEAADLLEDRPFCIGPSEDGGFWCAGTRIEARGVFSRVSLGTGRAMSDLARELERRGIPWAKGPTLWDVDTAEDLERWRA